MRSFNYLVEIILVVSLVLIFLTNLQFPQNPSSYINSFNKKYTLYTALANTYNDKFLSFLETNQFDVVGLLSILSITKYPIEANGFIGMLMILGFAIDNNVVLSTNIVKEKDKPFIERVRMSFRVGMLMEIIALYTLLLLYFIVPEPSVDEFAFVLSIAIILDLLYYLIGNIPLYKYFEAKKEQES